MPGPAIEKAALVLVGLFAWAHPAFAQDRLHIDAPKLSATERRTLASRLSLELGIRSESAAPLRLFLQPQAGALLVQVFLAQRLLIEREVPRGVSFDPTARVVVLLVSEALAAKRALDEAPPPGPTEPPTLGPRLSREVPTSTSAPGAPKLQPRVSEDPEPAPVVEPVDPGPAPEIEPTLSGFWAPAPVWSGALASVERLTLDLGLGGIWWREPAGGQLLVSLGVQMGLGRFKLGISTAVAGLCCAVNTDRFEGRALDLTAMLSAEWTFWSPPIARLSAVLGLGLGYERWRGRARFAGGLSSEQTLDAVDPAARLALRVERPVPSLGISLWILGGILVRAARLRVEIPGFSERIAPGVIGPWLSFGARAHFF